ncbi:hypothetical protein GUJ93_ZPchr0005g15518 [Zizania palustris]|uniref:Uncharacterized protein n=1 Tax=Zizania palustris TaxID=103762 RepID=A0A8J5W142_ZIZPA|nr:hypothetical protein GUJ93_ZPchr0005g15518 [Zizania palustris]
MAFDNMVDDVIETSSAMAAASVVTEAVMVEVPRSTTISSSELVMADDIVVPPGADVMGLRFAANAS